MDTFPEKLLSLLVVPSGGLTILLRHSIPGHSILPLAIT